MIVSRDFMNAAGVPFCAVLIEAGERYGLKGSLVADKPMVEFYDRRFPQYSELGQFVSRYCAQTLADSRPFLKSGLCLDGGIPAWNITAENAQVVYDDLVLTLCDMFAMDMEF